MPIVILPGVMGTRLMDPDTGELVWNPTGVLSSEPGEFAAVTERLMQVDRPLVPDEIHRFKNEKEHAKVANIRHYYNIITSFYGKLVRRMHFNLRGRLAPQGIVPVVYCCGYDFRLDNAVSAQRLAQIVTEAQDECDGEPVTIIAHSMGGLITRHFCKNLGGESRVRRVFLLGSPTLGSAKAYLSLREGLPYFDAVRLLLTPLSSSRRFMRSMPSVYQLLPTFLFGQEEPTWLRFEAEQTGMDPAAPRRQVDAMKFTDASNSVLLLQDIYTGITDDLEFRELSKKHFVTATLFDGGLLVGSTKTYMHPQTFTVFCENIPTDGRAFCRFITAEPSGDRMLVRSEVGQIRTVDGDETVPNFSANPTATSQPFVQSVPIPSASHQELANNASVIKFLLDKIESAS